MKLIKFDTSKFNFADIYGTLLSTTDLSKLHNSELNTYDTLFTREQDQSTKFHQIYYENFENSIQPIYKKFISDVVRPLYNGPIVYQKIPTFRIHLPGNIAVGEFHKDKWYRDKTWHEDVQEINYYLPFTNVFGTNTIWVETQEDKGDFAPIEVDYGTLVQWDGVNLMHGNKQNDTNKTRVSVDFRIMKYENYKPSTHGSINTKVKFEIGGYYDLMK